jgi:homoserine kinase
MDDVLHQPARARLIPGFRDVVVSAQKAGAWGAALSGAGSSVIAFCKPGKTAQQVSRAMERAFLRHRQKSQARDMALENRGVRYL